MLNKYLFKGEYSRSMLLTWKMNQSGSDWGLHRVCDCIYFCQLVIVVFYPYIWKTTCWIPKNNFWKMTQDLIPPQETKSIKKFWGKTTISLPHLGGTYSFNGALIILITVNGSCMCVSWGAQSSLSLSEKNSFCVDLLAVFSFYLLKPLHLTELWVHYR